jgi:hypothetical protein
MLSIFLTAVLLTAGVMFVVKPGAAIPDAAATIDIAALTRAAQDLPAQQYPGF